MGGAIRGAALREDGQESFRFGVEEWTAQAAAGLDTFEEQPPRPGGSELLELLPL
jgi:hypothetical protein